MNNFEQRARFINCVVYLGKSGMSAFSKRKNSSFLILKLVAMTFSSPYSMFGAKTEKVILGEGSYLSMSMCESNTNKLPCNVLQNLCCRPTLPMERRERSMRSIDANRIHL